MEFKEQKKLMHKAIEKAIEAYENEFIKAGVDSIAFPLDLASYKVDSDSMVILLTIAESTLEKRINRK